MREIPGRHDQGAPQPPQHALLERLSGIERPFSTRRALLANGGFVVFDTSFAIRLHSRGHGRQIEIVWDNREDLVAIARDGKIRYLPALPDHPHPNVIRKFTAHSGATIFVGNDYMLTNSVAETPAGVTLTTDIDSVHCVTPIPYQSKLDAVDIAAEMNRMRRFLRSPQQ